MTGRPVTWWRWVGFFFGSLEIFLTLTEHEKADRHVGQDPRVGAKLEHVVRE